MKIRVSNHRDIIGQKFNHLKVLAEIRMKKWKLHVKCICDCGKETVASKQDVISGHTKSCGCYHRENIKKGLSLKHGMTGTRTYNSYNSMRQRCSNPNFKDYHLYGGKGIKVCKRWLDDFENFLSDMGERPEGKTLDRKSSDGNYEPENCRWATAIEQANNTSRNNIIEFYGTRKTLAEWSRVVNVPATTLRVRLSRYGWSTQRTLTTPVRRAT